MRHPMPRQHFRFGEKPAKIFSSEEKIQNSKEFFYYIFVYKIQTKRSLFFSYCLKGAIIIGLSKECRVPNVWKLFPAWKFNSSFDIKFIFDHFNILLQLFWKRGLINRMLYFKKIDIALYILYNSMRNKVK